MKLTSDLYAVLRALVIEDTNRVLRAGEEPSEALRAAVKAVDEVAINKNQKGDDSGNDQKI